ncbi:MAG TPA: thioredoxin, partial [Novosphingobium sp.]
FAAVVLGLVAAVAKFGLPDWVPLARATFGQAEPDLVLDFPPNRQDRRTLPNGTEFFGASGTVTNVGQTRRAVPTILIVLRDGRERIVYSYEVAPPKRVLAPGESMTVNEAVTDVPKTARVAEIGWKPG